MSTANDSSVHGTLFILAVMVFTIAGLFRSCEPEPVPTQYAKQATDYQQRLLEQAEISRQESYKQYLREKGAAK